MIDDLTNKEFAATIRSKFQNEFEFYDRVQKVIEQAIQQPRDRNTAFARALDSLFIQAHKSFDSIYLLVTCGSGEDAATILRRLLEIVWQIQYLVGEADDDETKRSGRANRYLAYQFAPMLEQFGQDIIKDPVWQNALKEAKKGGKHLFNVNKHGNLENWWEGSIYDLSKTVGQQKVYSNTYSFLSKIAHGSSRALLARISVHQEEIRTEGYADKFLFEACKYMLVATLAWHKQFNLIDQRTIGALLTELEARHSKLFQQPST